MTIQSRKSKIKKIWSLQAFSCAYTSCAYFQWPLIPSCTQIHKIRDASNLLSSLQGWQEGSLSRHACICSLLNFRPINREHLEAQAGVRENSVPPTETTWGTNYQPFSENFLTSSSDVLRGKATSEMKKWTDKNLWSILSAQSSEEL